MATDPSLVAPPAAAPAADPNAAIYDALRKADAAGDADAVARLSQYLKQVPSGLADGHTQGFADEAPVEAQSTQLAPEQEKALIEYARQPGSTPEGLRRLGAQMGRTISNADEVFKAREAGAGVNDAIHYPLPKVEGGTTAPGAAIGGFADSPSLGLLPRIAALAGATRDLAHGGEFDYTAHLDKARGVEATDNEDHPYARIGGQLLGGLVLPSGTEGVAFTAGRDALQGGASMAEARAIASAAARNRMAGVGAGYGGAYGFNSSYGSPGERLASTATGALEGAAAGLGSGALAERLAPGQAARAAAARAVPMSEGQRVGAAANRLSNLLPGDETFDLLPADVGGPNVRRMTAGAVQAPLSASPVITAAQRVLDRGQRVAGAAADMSGRVAEPSAAGETARAGATAYITASGQQGGNLYDRAGRLAGNAMIDPAGARNMLDQQIARLRAVPGGGQGLQEAEQLRQSLNGRFSVQGIRDMRTEMFVDPALRGSPMDRRMRQIVDAAATDVENGLRAQGRGEAADAFRDADAFWRDRLDTIDNVIRPIIGNDGAKSGEAISKSIDAAAKGDVVKAQRFMATLPDEQQGVVRASFINRLGRATKGQQNDAGDAFSLSTFLSNWSELSPVARGVLFNPEQRAALTDLATVANGVRNAQKYANHSNSAGAVWANALAWLGIGNTEAVMHHPIAGVVTGVGGNLAQFGMGRLMASPRFARWLARAPRTQLSGAAYLDRLTRIARAEPAIANDVLGLQARLSSMLQDGPTRAAAQPDSESKR